MGPMVESSKNERRTAPRADFSGMVVGLIAGCDSGMSPDSNSFTGAAGGTEDDGFALTADPQDLVIDTTTTPPGTSADSMITATVFDAATDQPLEGVEVVFSADGGTLASGGTPVLTVANGTATDTLTVAVADPDSIEVTATENSASRTETTTPAGRT